MWLIGNGDRKQYEVYLIALYPTLGHEIKKTRHLSIASKYKVQEKQWMDYVSLH